MKKLGLNFNKKYMIIFSLLLILLLIIVFLIKNTYGYYQKNLELKDSLEMTVATLSYGLNEEYKVVVPVKGEVRVPIAVMGLNSRETKYQMYYRSSDDLTNVIVGYASYSSNLPSGSLAVGESKQISLILQNNGDSEITVFVGVKGGYQNNGVEDILLGNGEIRITNRIESEEVSEDMAIPQDILAGKKAWVNGNQITGTMANRGAVSQTLNAGGSYTIPEGYHNGSGKVTAASLASQTQATATAAQILTGKTAWVNGNKVTGSMANRGDLNWKPSTGTTYTVPAGYYSGGTLNSTTAYNNGYNEGYEKGKKDGTTLIDLGTGTSFNVSSYEGYQNFTTSNFLIVPSASASASASNVIRPLYTYVSSMSVNTSASIVSSYNSSTGVFSCYIRTSASTGYATSSGSPPSASANGNVHAYLIIK